MALQTVGAPSTMTGGGDSSTIQIAAAVGEAVAKVLNTGSVRESWDWAGVAGSRAFTSRVKEYAGPTSTFKGWSSTFRENIPKEMRQALDWAEHSTGPIEQSEVDAAGYTKWDEEAWRCLAGVLKGPFETLKNTLASGRGLELWRQLYASHVTRSPDHADSIHRALYQVHPAKDVSEVRHKINVVKAGITQHDELAAPEDKMSEGSKRTLITRILPAEVAKHLAMQPRAPNVEGLVDKILK